MNQKTIFGIALGAFALSSATMAIYTPSQAYTKKHLEPSHSPSRSFQIAQASSTSAIEQSVHEKINAYRGSKGLSNLTRNSSIDSQARTHSRNMASGNVPFGHDGFRQRLTNTGLSYSAAAENVAYNCGSSDPAKTAVDGWLKSSGHRRNIEGNYNLTGIGVAATTKNNCVYLYFTQIFMKS
ncbi:CAP domain-containing protein [Chlorogloeopsis sp. ULAP01]|uniref:CAP domain-containing protein n=1 Tax=Chlorogloeopsis sp. ULAP01 TaxID=3056483 RepID=UPI0025AA9390|nr:CAP domain-containing protein [Chlorogloeopsis sp. ULAP01]MDM9383847.1 CAP domain-containing protein [Chlorogloeopsis sp. ULAP01]